MKPLDLSFNAAVTTLARKVLEIARRKRVTIYTGGSDATIFGDR